MAKTVVAKKAVRRRKERKNIERGAVHISSTFNNTILIHLHLPRKEHFLQCL